MRLCTLVRERPTSRASRAVDARAFSRSAAISFSSMRSMALCLFHPMFRLNHTSETSKRPYHSQGKGSRIRGVCIGFESRRFDMAEALT
jgi:hypothetical protein